MYEVIPEYTAPDTEDLYDMYTPPIVPLDASLDDAYVHCTDEGLVSKNDGPIAVARTETDSYEILSEYASPDAEDADEMYKLPIIPRDVDVHDIHTRGDHVLKNNSPIAEAITETDNYETLSEHDSPDAEDADEMYKLPIIPLDVDVVHRDPVFNEKDGPHTLAGTEPGDYEVLSKLHAKYTEPDVQDADGMYKLPIPSLHSDDVSSNIPCGSVPNAYGIPITSTNTLEHAMSAQSPNSEDLYELYEVRRKSSLI
jgi:hypothetical protein